MNQVAIGARWVPGHVIRRDPCGAYEEVNCADKSAAEKRLIHNQLLAHELADLAAVGSVAFLLSAALIMFDAPAPVQAVAEVTGIMSLALLVGILPWSFWGWK